MFNTAAAKVLIGAGALAALGTTGALAATPGLTSPSPSASPAAKSAPARADVRQGVIIKLSDTEMTVERSVRDKATRATTKDDVTFELTATTRVFHAGSKDPATHEALKLGERVRVRFAEKDGRKVAHRVVILRDLRAGRVLSKGNDYLVIRTPEHGDVRVTVTDKTQYKTGRGKAATPGSFASIKVGDRVVALGEEDSQHNFDASAIRYNDPKPARSTPAAPSGPAVQ